MFYDLMILLLTLAGILSSLIVIKGKNRWKRLLGMSLISVKINMIMIIMAFATGRSFYLDIVLVYVILSYIGVNVIADFMIKRRKVIK